MKEMDGAGVKPDVNTYRILIFACSLSKDQDRADQVINQGLFDDVCIELFPRQTTTLLLRECSVKLSSKLKTCHQYVQSQWCNLKC